MTIARMTHFFAYRSGRALELLIILAALAAAGYFVAQIRDGRSVRDDGDAAAGAAARAAIAEPGRRPLPRDYEVIGARNVFGAKGATPARLGPVGPGEEPSRRDVVLVGTVLSPEGRGDMAVIEDPTSKKQRFYYVGDRIGDARVVAIERHKVILDEGGRRQALTMRYKDEAGKKRAVGPGVKPNPSPPSTP